MAMQIGDLIRMKREEHGLTQEQLAELIGKSAGYIGQLERGLSMASIPTLKRLVNVLSLDANQIFYDEKQDQYQFSELENMLSELDEGGACTEIYSGQYPYSFPQKALMTKLRERNEIRVVRRQP